MTTAKKALICELFYGSLFNSLEISRATGIPVTTVNAVLDEVAFTRIKIKDPVMITKKSKV